MVGRHVSRSARFQIWQVIRSFQKIWTHSLGTRHGSAFLNFQISIEPHPSIGGCRAYSIHLEQGGPSGMFLFYFFACLTTPTVGLSKPVMSEFTTQELWVRTSPRLRLVGGECHDEIVRCSSDLTDRFHQPSRGGLCDRRIPRGKGHQDVTNLGLDSGRQRHLRSTSGGAPPRWIQERGPRVFPRR